MRGNSFGLDSLSYLLQLTIVIVELYFVDDTVIINAEKYMNTKKEDILQQEQRVVDTCNS